VRRKFRAPSEPFESELQYGVSSRRITTLRREHAALAYAYGDYEFVAMTGDLNLRANEAVIIRLD
jgi:hypothetical protein